MNYNRNELGLLEGVEYQYNEDGSINWRTMIAAEHLYPNKGWFEARNKPMPNSVEGLEDMRKDVRRNADAIVREGYDYSGWIHRA